MTQLRVYMILFWLVYRINLELADPSLGGTAIITPLPEAASLVLEHSISALVGSNKGMRLVLFIKCFCLSAELMYYQRLMDNLHVSRDMQKKGVSSFIVANRPLRLLVDAVPSVIHPQLYSAGLNTI